MNAPTPASQPAGEAEQRPTGRRWGPEQIHEALVVVYPHHWIAPAVLGALLLWAIGFIVFGSIAVTGEGNAMFLTRGTVVTFQSPGTGQIGKWHVKVGDRVTRGQLLAELEQPVVEKQLEQARQQLADLKERNAVLESLTTSYADLEQGALERRRQMLEDRLAVLEEHAERSRELTELNHEEKIRFLDQKEKDLVELVDLESRRLDSLQEKLRRTQQLVEQRLRSTDELIQDRQAVANQRVRIADIQAQLVEHRLNQIKAAEDYLTALNSIASREETIGLLSTELEELRSSETDIRKRLVEGEFQRRFEVREIERNIERFVEQLADNREIRSEQDGRILELTASQGKLVTRGTRLGTIDAREEGAPLEAVAYFKVADGKQIEPGMTLRLTPATVERERFGSLIAKVASVSDYPVTAEGAAVVVGNESVAASLTEEGHQIEVFAELELEPDSPSGFLWDLSDGPELDVTSGTIATALVNIDERPPLTFIVPILREWQGFW